ncbi:E3 ubiquitin/ISG15 ligase TRIM25-like isoform X2 [Rhinatrema bivittatum]|uniref:E3 ubiquitin/ISG15 ligase TRIM25-like isoform X2 n=1 Tax=Rhinatrema bivittatum TaxID=194408 RepID=UPI00112889E5|nr:E3 ubiquitin/ISG15 ligase TRIM25-like isoform X2 [Rhinatrema bivittatum]
MAAAEKEEEVVDLGRVREDLECPICMSFLSCPVTLGCGHNFCHRCIARHWEDARRGYQCPLCQATWPSLPQLSKNTALAALVEKIRPRSSPAAAPLLCPGAEAGALCLTCMGSCQRREGAPPSHLLVRPPNSLALAGWPCRDHARALQHFCRTHGLPVCPACAGQQQHSACQLVALLPEFRQRQEHLKTKISEMSVELKRKEDAISKKMEESSQINISLSEIRASLTQSFQDMKRIIEGQKCAALRKVEEERQRAEQEIANDIKAFTVEVTKLKDFRAKSQHTVEDDWLGLLQGKPLDEENCMMFPEQPESPAFDSKEVRALVSAVEKLKQSLLENSTLEEFPLQEQQGQCQDLGLRNCKSQSNLRHYVRETEGLLCFRRPQIIQQS